MHMFAADILFSREAAEQGLVPVVFAFKHINSSSSIRLVRISVEQH